jgi:hypothetical protein
MGMNPYKSILISVYYSSIKIFSHLPFTITKYKSDTWKFKTALKRYLVDNAFYSIEVFLSTNRTQF